MENTYWPEWLEEIFDHYDDYPEYDVDNFEWDYVEEEDEMIN